jgi:hypothetical protein
MIKKSDRNELQRRLEQARRMAGDHHDPLTKERLAELIRDLEEQLRDRSKAAPVVDLFQVKPSFATSPVGSCRNWHSCSPMSDNEPRET